MAIQHALLSGLRWALVASLFLQPSPGLSDEISCTSQEVRTFSNRVHVRCLESYPDSSGAASIRFFAAPSNPTRLYEDLRDFGGLAMAGHGAPRLVLNYDPADTSGTSFGCQAHDCRRITAVRLVRPGPYVMRFDVDGIARSAHIYPSTLEGNVGPSPVVFYFHGHTGTQWDSTARRRFHSLWPQATIVYAQGMAVDHNGLLDPPGQDIETDNVFPGWQIRFPYKASPLVNFTNDIQYIEEIIERLHRNHSVARDQIYAVGHSGGAFFTLSLIDLLPDVFSKFAVVAAYSRFDVNINDSLRPYRNGAAQRIPLNVGADPSPRPKPVLYAFGTNDTVFDNDSPDGIPGWRSNPAVQTRSSQTVNDLRARIGCQNVPSQFDPNNPQTFDARNNGGSVLYWWPYNGTHSFPQAANQAVIDFLRDAVQHPISNSQAGGC